MCVPPLPPSLPVAARPATISTRRTSPDAVARSQAPAPRWGLVRGGAPMLIHHLDNPIASLRAGLAWAPDRPPISRPAILRAAVAVPNRRFKLINVEHTINELTKGQSEFQRWPHLGLLYVGTVADQEGWDVALHDELVDGYVDLERFVAPGDVV